MPEPLPGLLVDFGGVLTTNVFEAFAGFCDREGLDRDVVRRAFREDETARGLLIALELGELGEDEFSRALRRRARPRRGPRATG